MLKSLDFETVIGYEFRDKELLERALTHSSFLPQGKDRPKHNNERLEFLGDAFFDAIVSVELCRILPGVEEGTLTKTRAVVVCEQSLAREGERLDIGSYLRMGKGESASGGRKRASIVADAMEAVIGAIFLDGGYEAAAKFVVDNFSKTIKLAAEGKLFSDYKTALQESLPPGTQGRLKYVVTREEGPDHDKSFFVDAVFGDRVLASGMGKSKKEAENSAAKSALEKGVF
jgi:ribonuclease-3